MGDPDSRRPAARRARLLPGPSLRRVRGLVSAPQQEGAGLGQLRRRFHVDQERYGAERPGIWVTI